MQSTAMRLPDGVRNRAVAYIRVSTDKEEQKSSLKNQREFFEDYVKRNGDTLLRIYCDEAKSATKMKNRTELNAMIRAARAHEFDKLYVKDVSRLFRNMRDFLNVMQELAELKIMVYYVDLGGIHVDPLILQLFAMLAQSESEKMSTRIKFAKEMGKARGIVPNFVFGYDRIDKFTLVPNPEQAEIVRTIFDKYTEERWGQCRIAQYLHEQGVKTKKMKQEGWSQTVIKGILKNQIYIGRVINGKETTQGALTNKRDKHPESEWFVVERPEFRIISDEQFQKAQAIMAENAEKFPQQTRQSSKHIFSNLIKCGHCGFSYRRWQRQYSPNTPVKVWWTCSHRSAYGGGRCEAEHIRIDEDWLLACLRQMLGAMVENKSRFFALVERRCNEAVKSYLASTMAVTPDEIKERVRKLEKERETIKEMVRQEMISMDEAKQDMIPLNHQLDKLRFQLAEAKNTADVTKQVKESVKRFMRDFSAFQVTENLTNGDLKRVIEKIVVMSKEEIYVYFKLGNENKPLSVPFSLTDTLTIDTDSHNRTQGHLRAAGGLSAGALRAGKGGAGREQGPAPPAGRRGDAEEI